MSLIGCPACLLFPAAHHIFSFQRLLSFVRPTLESVPLFLSHSFLLLDWVRSDFVGHSGLRSTAISHDVLAWHQLFDDRLLYLAQEQIQATVPLLAALHAGSAVSHELCNAHPAAEPAIVNSGEGLVILALRPWIRFPRLLVQPERWRNEKS
jgi:hypothetical protein